VFSSNGHQFVEFDEETGVTSEARPLNEFPRPDGPNSVTTACPISSKPDQGMQTIASPMLHLSYL
jgi:hypothetical protein